MADEQITSNTANIPFVNLADQGADPTTPASGRVALYSKGGTVYVRLSDGTVVPVGGSITLAEGQLAIGDASDQITALSVGTEGQVVTADASGFAAWADLPEGGGGAGQGHLSTRAYNYNSSSGTAWTLSASTLQNEGWFLGNGNGALNDSITYKVSLEAGTWTFRAMTLTAAGYAIWSVYLGATKVGEFDCYSASAAYNIVVSITGISVATSGLYDLTLKAESKHASSTNYGGRFTNMAMWRTA